MENENIIIEYLQDKLSEEQKGDFEQRLKTDQNFHEEYLMLKRMHSYLLERKDREEYTAKIEKLETKYFQPNNDFPKRSFKRILILTIIILMAILTLWYLLKPKNVNLYESNSDHFALHLVLKNSDNTIALNAENAFNNEDFGLAIVELKKYLKNNGMDTKAKLALGICYLEIGNNTEALKIFDEISTGSSTLKDYGTWYKALYFVKNLDYEQTEEMLKNISKMDVQLYDKTQNLLRDIENLKASNLRREK